MGQVIVELAFRLEQVGHIRDVTRIPPGDVTILGRGHDRLRHPLIHGVLDAVVSDNNQACVEGFGL